MIHFKYIRCEYCKYPLDFWFFGVSTFLGPELANCHRCRETIFTGRSEWHQKSLKERLIFIAMAALYIGAGGYAFGYSFFRMSEMHEKLPPVKDPSIEQLKFEWLSGAFLIVMILSYKFFHSLRRRNETGDAPSEESMWSWSLTFGTQPKMLLFLFFLHFLAGASAT